MGMPDINSRNMKYRYVLYNKELMALSKIELLMGMRKRERESRGKEGEREEETRI